MSVLILQLHMKPEDLKFENESFLLCSFRLSLNLSILDFVYRYMLHTMWIRAVIKIRAFSKLLRLLFAAPQPLLCDPLVGNNWCRQINNSRDIASKTAPCSFH